MHLATRAAYAERVGVRPPPGDQAHRTKPTEGAGQAGNGAAVSPSTMVLFTMYVCGLVIRNRPTVAVPHILFSPFSGLRPRSPGIDPRAVLVRCHGHRLPLNLPERVSPYCPINSSTASLTPQSPRTPKPDRGRRRGRARIRTVGNRLWRRGDGRRRGRCWSRV